jgi:hypothetical protein
MGRAHALARPGHGDHAGWHAWTFWPRSGLANASLARARAVHGDDQQGQGILLDTIKVNGGDLREGCHAGRHGVALALSRL